MALNITAERRVDISDFGQGWDGCYLLVKTMNMKEIKDWQEKIQAKDGDAAEDLYTEKLKTILTGGVIMNTDEKGVATRYTLEAQDIPDAIDQIGPVYQQRALMTASGTYGLKRTLDELQRAIEDVIVRDMVQSADPDIIDAIADERFKDKRHLSTEVFEREPWESIWMARTVWAADAKREALDKKRRS